MFDNLIESETKKETVAQTHSRSSSCGADLSLSRRRRVLLSSETTEHGHRICSQLPEPPAAGFRRARIGDCRNPPPQGFQPHAPQDLPTAIPRDRLETKFERVITRRGVEGASHSCIGGHGPVITTHHAGEMFTVDQVDDLWCHRWSNPVPIRMESAVSADRCAGFIVSATGRWNPFHQVSVPPIGVETRDRTIPNPRSVRAHRGGCRHGPQTIAFTPS